MAYVTDEKNTDLQEIKDLWKSVYIATIRAGYNFESAQALADKAVRRFKEFIKEQGE